MGIRYSLSNIKLKKDHYFQNQKIKALENEIKKQNVEKSVFLMGFLKSEELQILYQHIDLFILPSHEEPFGIVLLEAMSAKRAIVASNVGGIPEVLGKENEGL